MEFIRKENTIYYSKKDRIRYGTVHIYLELFWRLLKNDPIWNLN